MKEKRKIKSNFTLIELLVVIAIIAILAAMLLPSLNKVKKTGNEVNCTSNMKQISLAQANYVMTYNDYCTGAANHRGLNENGFWYDIMFLHKTVDPRMLSCKLNTTNIEFTNDSGTASNNYLRTPTTKSIYRRTYLANILMGYLYKNPSANDVPIVKVPALKGPSVAIFNICGSWENYSHGVSGMTNLQEIYQPGKKVKFLHSRGYNLLFADGHIATAGYAYIQSITNTNRKDNIGKLYNY
jgi:prepilin-type N-terminal cleavage/methylation domain-containing protein/prepilin-type processing-associated H-X9-DG protein